jgi:butyrate kinase
MKVVLDTNCLLVILPQSSRYRCLWDLFRQGKYTQTEVTAMINGKGGLTALCNSNDVQQLVHSAQAGDRRTELILQAMCYQIAKEIGAMSAVLKGEIDAILITGGIANNQWITGQIETYISFIAPVHVYPGEDEMAALAMNVQLMLAGEITLKEYR